MQFFVFYDQFGDVTALSSGDGGIPPTFGSDSLLEVSEAQFDQLRRSKGWYYKDGKFVTRPPTPGAYHDWDAINKAWVLNEARQYEVESESVRTTRNKLLADSDWTDTLSAKTRLGEAKYDEWQAYRQALRDITAQPGFPTNVVWPTPPA